MNGSVVGHRRVREEDAVGGTATHYRKGRLDREYEYSLVYQILAFTAFQNMLLEAARARGRQGGRPKAIEKIEPRNLARAKELYAAKQNTVREIMQMTGFKSRNTFYKYVVNGDKPDA